MDFLPGQLLHNRYQIERKLGQGGMGAVYLALDTALDNQVAVKVNRNPSSQGTSQFMREARLLASLRHSNLPRVTDYFVLESDQYLVMDYIAGRDLDSILKEEGPQPLARVLSWVQQVGGALGFLHSQNPAIVHRDVKPANVRLSPEGQAVLVDFGIAKFYDPSQATTTGAMGYTPGYAPPEQYGGTVRTGPYTDQYSLAALMYHLLTGQKPADAIQRALGKQALAPLSQTVPGIPSYVQNAVTRALSLRPEDRFGSIDAFLQALSGPVESTQTLYAQPVIEQTIVGEMEGLTAVQGELAPALPRKINWMLFGIIGAVIVVLGVAAVVVGGMLASRSPGSQPTQVGAVIAQPSETPLPESLAKPTDAPAAEPATSTPEPQASPTEMPSPTFSLFTETPLPTATPQIIGGGGVVVFSSNRADPNTYQLYSMRIGLNDQGQVIASDVTQLTTSQGSKRQPAFSPDGTRLLYVADGGKDGKKDIWMMNADGSGEPIDLTADLNGNELDPAWSPDGQWIAFTRDSREDKVLQVYIMRPDGSATIRLSFDQNEGDPAWTPNMELGFVQNLYGNMVFKIRLTTDPRTGATPESPYYVTPVPFDRGELMGRLGNVAEPVFSPDGQWLAYTYTRSTGAKKRIFVSRVPVQQEAVGLTDLKNDSSPSWSPDSQWIVFTSDRDGEPEIYVMRNSGQTQTNLTNAPGSDVDPVWQPVLP